MFTGDYPMASDPFFRKTLALAAVGLSLLFVQQGIVFAELATISPDFNSAPPSTEWSIQGNVSFANGIMAVTGGVRSTLSYQEEAWYDASLHYYNDSSQSIIAVSADVKLPPENDIVPSSAGIDFHLFDTEARDRQHLLRIMLHHREQYVTIRVDQYLQSDVENTEPISIMSEEIDSYASYDTFYNLKIKLFDTYVLFYVDATEVCRYRHNLALSGILHSSVDFHTFSHGDIGSDIGSRFKNVKIAAGSPQATVPLDVSKISLNLWSEAHATVNITGGTGFYAAASSNEEVAQVSLSGSQAIITGMGKGNAVITIVDNENNSRQIAVSVININPSRLTLTPNQSQVIIIDGSTGFYQLSSSDENVAEVEMKNGDITVTGIAVGTATITITDSNAERYTVPVTVQYSSGTLSVDKDDVGLTEGDTEILTISGGTPPYSAVSDDSSIASSTVVSDKLSIEGLKKGDAHITVTDSSSNSVIVSVTVNEIEYLCADPTTLTIPMLNTAKLEISGGTGYYQITSTDESVATYSVTGDNVTVKGESIGTAKIIITDSDGSSVLVPVSVTQKIKAVIAAASGPYTGNHLWDSTLACTQYAYKVLRYQGYTDDTIQFLASDTVLDINGDGLFTEVDGNATSNDLKNAITNWALDARDVIVYIVGHGSQDSLRIDENELVTASELNSWFNMLEGYIPGKLTFIYDACQSGSFLSDLIPADRTRERILIASASLGENAYFTSLGALSFSTLFWTQIHNGGNIRDSFTIAKTSIEYTYTGQTPLLDDTGNGIGNEDEDGTLSQQIYIGNGVISAGDIPVIGSASPDTNLNGETTFVFYADNVIDSNAIEKVWAIVTPPDFSPADPDSPVLSVPTVEMNAISGNRYEGIYKNFEPTGTYNVAIYARDSEGNISLPKRLTVTQKTSTCRVNISGYSVSGVQAVNSPMTITVNASSDCSDTLHYRFSMHPGYGTPDYDGTRWTQMTATEFQTGNQCTYTFTETGKYIVVIWVVADTAQTNAEVPIIGFSVDVGEDSPCRTAVTGSRIAGTQTTGSPVSFTVNAQNSCSNALYYRFSKHPYYGTSWYNGYRWSSLSANEWIASNSIDVTFDESGKYVIVVWISDDTDADFNGIPIMGWSVDIE